MLGSFYFCFLMLWEGTLVFKGSLGVPAGAVGSVASWEPWDTGLIPAWHSELRVQRCRSFSLGCNCGSDLSPGQGTLYALGGQKREK